MGTGSWWASLSRQNKEYYIATLRSVMLPAGGIIFAAVLYLALWSRLLVVRHPLVATSLAYILLGILPGLLLLALIHPNIQLPRPTLPAASLALSIALTTPIAIAGFFLSWSLDLLLGLHLAIILALGTVVVVRRLRISEISNYGLIAKPSTHPLLMVILLGMVILAVLKVAQAPRDVDDWAAISYIRRYFDAGHLTLTEPFLGTDSVQPKQGLSIQIYYQALIGFLAKQEPRSLIHSSLPPLLGLASLGGFFGLAKQVLGNSNRAAFATILQIIAFFIWIFPGEEFQGRLVQDKMTAWMVIFPIALLLLIRAVDEGRRRDVILFALVTITMAVVHPVIFLLVPMAAASYGLVRLLWPDNTSRQVLLRRFVWLGLAIAIASIYPFGQYIWGKVSWPEWFAATSTDNLANYGMRLWTLKKDRIFYITPQLYALHPAIILQPANLVGFVLAPFLLLKIKKDRGAQLLLSLMVLPTLLLYNPWTVKPIAAIITPWMLYRLTWIWPTTLVVAWAGIQLAGWLSSRLNRSATRRRISEATLLALMLLTALPTTAKGMEHMREWHGRTIHYWWNPSEDAERFLLQASHQIHPGTTVLAKYEINLYISAYINANVISFRGAAGILPAAFVDEIRQRNKDVSQFGTAQALTDDILDIIRRHQVNYVIATSPSSLASQLRAHPEVFASILQSESLELFEVMQRPSSIPLARGYSSLEKGEWTKAEAAFAQLQQEGLLGLWAMLGSARVQLARGQEATALALCDEADSLLPNTPWPALQRAQIYEVRAELTRAAGEYERAAKLLPLDAEVRSSLARLFIKLGQRDLANEWAEAAADVPVSGKRRGEWQTAMDRALLKRRLGLWPEAMADLQKAEIIAPDNDVAHAIAGNWQWKR